MPNLTEVPGQQDIEIVRGGGLPITVTVTKLDGTAYPLTGGTLRLYIKLGHETANGSALKTYTTADASITITDDVLGIARINRTTGDFASLTDFPDRVPRAWVLWVDPAIEPAVQGNWTVRDL